MNIKYDKIGFRLAKRRKKLKYTQPQLAEIVGISKNHISQFENGGSVSLEVLLDLCDALKITPDYLLLGTIRDTPSEDFIDLIKHFGRMTKFNVSSNLAWCSFKNHFIGKNIIIIVLEDIVFIDESDF